MAEEYYEETANLGEECAHCFAPFVMGDTILVQSEIGDLLHQSCREDYEDAENERRYERWMSDYYGGSVPTLMEKVIQDWKVNP